GGGAGGAWACGAGGAGWPKRAASTTGMRTSLFMVYFFPSAGAAGAAGAGVPPGVAAAVAGAGAPGLAGAAAFLSACLNVDAVNFADSVTWPVGSRCGVPIERFSMVMMRVVSDRSLK